MFEPSKQKETVNVSSDNYDNIRNKLATDNFFLQIQTHFC